MRKARGMDARFGRLHAARSVWLCTLLTLASVLASAQGLPPRPQTLVNDYAGVLSLGNRAALHAVVEFLLDSL